MSSRLAKSLIILFVVVAAARFFYSVTYSPKGWSGDTYMDLSWSRQHDRITSVETGEANRWWGPMFFITYGTLKAVFPQPEALDTAQRVIYVGLWFAILALLVSMARPLKPSADSFPYQAMLVALGLHSTAAIYVVTSGTAEMVTGFCVIAHCHQFERRRFLSAAFLLVFGVYFKLFPVVFLGPYLVFSAVSPSHRRYLGAVATATVVIAAVALWRVGWTLGALYPFSMVAQTLLDGNNVVPMASREVFGLVFLVSRTITGFEASAVAATPQALIRVLTVTFSLLLLAGTTIAAVLFARTEPRWGLTPHGRRQGLLLFQMTIGLIYVSCAMDVSIPHLMMLSFGVYAALILMSLDAGPFQLWSARQRASLVIFLAGAWLIGTIAPLSVVMRLLPLSTLNQWAGNATSGMILQEQYLWYQVPLLALYLLGLAAWMMASRRTPAPSH
jgi:hypothetical protein